MTLCRPLPTGPAPRSRLPLEPLSLVAAIRWVLKDPQRAERLWDPARVAGLYAEVYGQALERADQNDSAKPSLS